MITDYLLGAVCLGLGARLLRKRMIAASLAFVAIALAAITGGSHHGLGSVLSDQTLAALWRCSLAGVGLSNFFLVVAALNVTVPGSQLRAWIVAAALQLLIYLLWIASHDDFRAAIYDYIAGMAAILWFCWIAARRGGSVFARWMAAGIAVSVAASAIQVGRLAPSVHFNHNDLYHVIQTGAVVLFYQAFVRVEAPKVIK